MQWMRPHLLNGPGSGAIRRGTPFRRLAAIGLLLYSAAWQAPGQTAPTAGTDPAALDQLWKQANSKYDQPREALLRDVDRVSHAGPFRPDYESLNKYQTPEWFRDAKFGIFIHWGVYSVPAFGREWYPREMYIEGTDIKASGCDVRSAEQVWLQRFHSHVQGGTFRRRAMGTSVQGLWSQVCCAGV